MVGTLDINPLGAFMLSLLFYLFSDLTGLL